MRDSNQHFCVQTTHADSKVLVCSSYSYACATVCVCVSTCSHRQRVEQMNAPSGSESEPLGVDYRGLLPKSPIDNETIRELERELLRFLSLSRPRVVEVSLLLEAHTFLCVDCVEL